MEWYEKIKKLLKIGLSIAIVMSGFLATAKVANASTSLMTYPNVQQYTKEAGQDFTLAENSRIFCSSKWKNIK